MTTNISSLLNMGQNALLGNQAAIQVVGNNIANVDTVGYSRQEVRFEAAEALNGQPGQIGTGAYAAEVVRNFDRFIERSFLEKSAAANRWAMEYQMQLSIDGLFNESSSMGINSQLSTFFNSWQDLSTTPSSLAVRETLISNSQNLAKVLRESQEFMQSLEERINTDIETEVEEINKLLERIADLNRQINIVDEPGKNNANTLLDQRDAAVRELATHIDVEVIDLGSGDYTVATAEGHTLVHKENAFELETRGPETRYYAANKGAGFDGAIQFSGKSYHEYTVEVVTGGVIDDGTGAGGTVAEFRVSLDGGKTWISDDQGNPVLFKAQDSEHAVNVAGLDIYFEAGTVDLAAGDNFVITPKSGVYWVSPTGDCMNISPQKFPNGLENDRRMSGGTLAGLLNFRDYQLGHYRERLDNLSKSIIWEVNRLHSQGAGMEKSEIMSGTYAVQQSDAPLGSDYSGLTFADRLQSGNVSFYMYDRDSGEYVSTGMLDFDPATAGIQNFNPEEHSLDDVCDAINNMVDPEGNPLNPPPLQASIQNNRLIITVNPAANVTFAVGDDTAGLLAGLGLNTFFEGSTAVDLAVRAEVVQNNALICAGQVNGGNEGNIGDNITALGIADLANQKVDIGGVGIDNPTRSTLGEYYSALVGLVGGDTSNAQFRGQYELTLANDLDSRQASISGVNLDEELASLIKFQNTYKAAAKLINTADQMFQTILGLKN